MQHCENSLHPPSQQIESTFEQRTRRLNIMKILTILSLGVAVLCQVETQANNERDEFSGSFSSLANNCAKTKGCSDFSKESIPTGFNITGKVTNDA